MNAKKRWLAYIGIAVCTGAAIFAAADTGLSWTASDGPAGKCGYYTNSARHSVPRPCGDWHSDQTRPPGAAAQCRDGTWTLANTRPLPAPVRITAVVHAKTGLAGNAYGGPPARV
jgi:hypothetical protein